MVSDIVILCGGYGTRIREISIKLPKVLLKVNKKPFLYWVLKNLENKGFKKVFLCVGYKGYLIKEFVKRYKCQFSLKIIFSQENGKNLLGTGGAVRKILKKLSNFFYIVNGDTFFFINFKKMQFIFFKKKKPILMAVHKNFDADYPNNVILKKNYLYYDKNILKKNMKYIDYGIMLVKKKIFLKSKKKFQISDFLNRQSVLKNIAYFKVQHSFFEIGNINGYKKTIKNYKKINSEVYRSET
jgi:NDP-sugar pyrophosphorylase family protein